MTSFKTTRLGSFFLFVAGERMKACAIAAGISIHREQNKATERAFSLTNSG